MGRRVAAASGGGLRRDGASPCGGELLRGVAAVRRVRREVSGSFLPAKSLGGDLPVNQREVGG